MGRACRIFLIFISLGGLLSLTLSCKKRPMEKKEIRFPRAAEISLEDSPFFLYVPTEEEMNDYVLFAGYLADLESGKKEVSPDQINDLFIEMYNVNNLHSLTFEAFLLSTKNHDMRKYVLKYLEENTLDLDFKTAIKRKYLSIPEFVKKGDEAEFVRYSFDQKFYDENITLFNLAQTTFFDEGLGLLLYQNSWQSMGFSPEPNVRSFALGTGGETNSLAMNFAEFSYIDFDDFLSLTENSIYVQKYKNWQVDELPIEGVLKRANADKIFIACGDGVDTLEGIESAALVLYLYNSEMQKGYEIVYYMNYSKENINFALRSRQSNVLLFNLLFAYME